MMKRNSLFRRKELNIEESNRNKLTPSLGSIDLMFLGVGAVVGTGIFILPGTVAAKSAGPGIIFSFVLAAIVCAFSALCYSEFSSRIPIAGSAYSYGYMVFGELIGWMLGWALVLEYGLAVASVASGWSAYLNSLLLGFHLQIPHAMTAAFSIKNGTIVNLPAIIVVLVIAALLTAGIRESTRVNTIMVVVKIVVILLFLAVGIFYVRTENWDPFLPYGLSGVFNGASIVIFAYLGFDAVSSAAEEVKNPQRNMPIGIIGALAICTILYVAVSAVLTGIVSYKELDVTDPVAFAIHYIHQDWAAGLISLGAVTGMITVLLVMSYGATRLVYAISRDGLLPKAAAKLSGKKKIPVRATWIFAVCVSLVAGFIPLDELAALVNMGTLLAFMAVSVGILFLRKNKEIPEGGFKVPFYPVVPIISFLLCLFLISRLSATTMIACGIWFVIGLLIYFIYGRKHSNLNGK